MSKSPVQKAAVKKAHSSRRKPNRKKVVSEKASVTHLKKAPHVAAQKIRDTNRKAAAQFQEATMPAVAESSATQVKVSLPAIDRRSVEDFHAQVSDSMRGLTERNLEQMRKRCENSLSAFENALKSWEDSLDAAAQGAVALNRKIRDAADDPALAPPVHEPRIIKQGNFDWGSFSAFENGSIEVERNGVRQWFRTFSELKESLSQTAESRIPGGA
jgi:hypothetical protein